MLHAHLTALSVIDAESLTVEFLHCTEADTHVIQASVAYVPIVDIFRSCDLDGDPMTIYEPDTYYLEIYRISKYELPTSKFSKVIL